MKYPEKGTIVKVTWFDAFSYKGDDEEAIRGRTEIIKTNIGEWHGVHTAEKCGKTIEYCDIRNEWSNGGGMESDGTKIPTGWIISIEEYEPKKKHDEIIKDRDPRHIEIRWDLNQCN